MTAEVETSLCTDTAEVPTPMLTSAPAPATKAATRPELDHLFSVAYEELRRLAAAVRGNDPGETLNPTALVNEAYLKIAGSLSSAPVSRLHFKRIAARAMRQVLVEAARRRKALKRGGGEIFVTLDDALDGTVSGSEELLALDAALQKLARLSPRQAALVENRFFGGFDLQEIATLLEISASTVARDWRAAKAWLALELKRST
jgi:RNA polymerase sigma factor (TIGR02999 family)